MELTPRHPIKVVVRRTGLSAHVIRVWEKRYQAVMPARTETNRRLYSDEDIARLQWLQQAVQAGNSIGQIAHLPTPELANLVHAEQAAAPLAQRVPNGEGAEKAPSQFIEQALVAVQRLDAVSLENQLNRASIALSQRHLIEEVVQPLMERIGQMWQEGILRVADEHMASAVVRNFIGNMRASFQVAEAAPRVVSTTPAGQLHEMGALLATVVATSEGWSSTFLGPNLPAEEIARAAAQRGAKAALLSIIYPGDDPHLGGELLKLRQLLGDDMALLAGGRAAQHYRPFLERAGAITLANLSDLRDSLSLLRQETILDQG